jgi:hypothetical protein
MLISNSDITNYLNMSDIPEDYDFLTEISNYAQGYCKGYCRQPLETESVVSYYNGNDSTMIILNEFPVTAITKLEVRQEGTNTWDTIVSTNYWLMPLSSLFACYYKEGFQEGYSNIRITYTCGYTSSTIPYDLKLVIVEIAATIYKESNHNLSLKGGRLGLSQMNETIQGITTNTYYKDLIPKWNSILDSNRLVCQ